MPTRATGPDSRHLADVGLRVPTWQVFVASKHRQRPPTSCAIELMHSKPIWRYGRSCLTGFIFHGPTEGFGFQSRKSSFTLSTSGCSAEPRQLRLRVSHSRNRRPSVPRQAKSITGFV